LSAEEGVVVTGTATGTDTGTELETVVGVTGVIVEVVDGDVTDVVGVSRATTCDELPPHAASATATPVSTVARTSFGVFIAIPPRASRSLRVVRFIGLAVRPL
jgi:hypothetical protein